MKGSPCPVRVEQTGQIYPSVKKAFEALGLKPNGASYKLYYKGKPVRGWLITPITEDDPDWRNHPRRKTPPIQCRPVRCIETGEIYKSGADAARAIYVVKNSVYQSIHTGCRAGGFHWQWADR